MIKIFTGPMFSGKTNGLVSAYEHMWNKDIIQCFKPQIDTRDGNAIKTRFSNHTIVARSVESILDMCQQINEKTRVVFIDEAQFLRGNVSAIKWLAMNQGIDFYIAGLNMTSELEPFGIMPQLMSIADEIIFYEASCFYCNKPAKYTFYKGENEKDSDILVGNDEYIPVCEKCYIENIDKSS